MSTTQPPAERRPQVSVIVPCFNDAERIVLCIEALFSQTYPQDHIEIVVVDNGSTDGCGARLAHYPSVRVVREDAEGSYAARNAGILTSRGDLLAFTDSDCVPDRYWLMNAVAALQVEPSLDFVVGAIAVFPRDPHHQTAVECYELALAFPQARYAREGWGATANVVTRRSTMTRFGMFNAALKSGGDREWGERVTAGGGRLRYVENAVVRHPARASWTEVSTKQRRVLAGIRQRGDRMYWGAWFRGVGGVAKDLAIIARCGRLSIIDRVRAAIVALGARVIRAKLTFPTLQRTP